MEIKYRMGILQALDCQPKITGSLYLFSISQSLFLKFHFLAKSVIFFSEQTEDDIIELTFLIEIFKLNK